MTVSRRTAPIRVLLPLAIALFILPETAHAGPFVDCVARKLGDLVDLAVLTGIIALIRYIVQVGVEKYLQRLVERGIESATKRLLGKLAKALGKRIIPWVGLILFLYWLIDFLWECIPLLF